MVLQIKMLMAPGQPLVSYRASEGLQADSWRNSGILPANCSAPIWLKRASSQAPQAALQHPWKTAALRNLLSVQSQ